MGILQSMKKTLFIQVMPWVLNRSVPLFSHLQNGSSRHTHLIRLWVAEMTSVLSDKHGIEFCSCGYHAAKAGGAPLPLQTPKLTRGLSWLCEGQKDPRGRTQPSWLGAEGSRLHHP